MTARYPLGTTANPFNYTWDAYDRLTQSTRTGGATVNYTYDALGRLLKRTQNPSTDNETTVKYWLGLNMIAEEKWGTTSSGAAMTVLRPDSEANSDPKANGWYAWKALGTEQMQYVTDPEGTRGNVLHLSTNTGGATVSNFLLGDEAGGNDNPNANPWNEADRLYIGLWIKNGDTNSNRQPMRVSALVTNTSDQRSLNWVIGSGSFSDTSTCKYLSNYATYNDGGWHYVELDLKGQLASKGETIKKVNGLVLRGADLYVDDVVLSGGVMVNTYQLVPQGRTGSYLGSQNGLSGGWTTSYYHYSDSWNIIATTDHDGQKISVSVSDAFGNYRYINGNRPDTLGLTSKFLDLDTGLYYFNARWYDSERGRWISKDLIPNIDLYVFCENSPENELDYNGLTSVANPPPSGGPGFNVLAPMACILYCNVRYPFNVGAKLGCLMGCFGKSGGPKPPPTPSVACRLYDPKPKSYPNPIIVGLYPILAIIGGIIVFA